MSMNFLDQIRPRRLDRIEATLAVILKTLMEFKMSATNSLAALQAAVAAETAVDQSVETLLTQLAAELAAASPTGDNPAIDAVVATMTANAATLRAAVTANTPVVPAPTVSGSAA
jgi:hypothetical protein